MYLEYFRRQGHQVMPSSSLLPDDPTLLFTSAGMVQFKDIFWGKVHPRYSRATTCQKCIRTNDIERVGTTAYHHTFFEMLGNFSFGDYFKEGAITLAWEFLTRELGLNPERLWVSVYEEDKEAEDIWVDVVGIPPERLVRLGKEDNWWGPVGDRGPCGPDTEVFWDWGEELACGSDCAGPACDCPRFSEIWNLVFIQFDAQPDGKLLELDRKNIDTGMGLERTVAVLQGVMSDFDTDLFAPVVRAVEELAGGRCQGDKQIPRNVIADHIRALVFLVADGVLPANEAQGYVLRRILRRTVRAADRLSLPAGALAKLVPPVVESLGEVYPEIVERRSLAEQVISWEEQAFRRTLRTGEAQLRQAMEGLNEGAQLPGRVVFELYDTYGFPVELTEEIAGEAGISVDRAGFEQEMERQRARSRQAVQSEEGISVKETAEVIRETKFVGYDCLEMEAELVLITDTEGAAQQRAEEGDWRLAFPEAPFYAEAGGQVADTGWVVNLSRMARAEVRDVQQTPQGTVHIARVLEGEFRQGDRCRLQVDGARRRAIERAHTSTHLLHAALRETVGEHAIQAGSWVGPEEVRFDFTHFASLSDEERAQVEQRAFAAVLGDLELRIRRMSLEEAVAAGAMAHFEEEYRGREQVRVVEVPGVSCELCGGTHVRRTGEIGALVILGEEAVGSGTRRIRALVGEKAREHFASLREEQRRMAGLLGVPEGEVESGVDRALEELRVARRRAAALEEKLTAMDAEQLSRRAEEIDGVRLLGAVVEGGPERAKMLVDALAARLERCAVLLGTETDERAVLVAKVADAPQISAGDLVRVAAQAVGGKGGGRPTFAQGGGPDAAALPQAVRDALEHARAALKSA
ncbi:MAG: alanine--tRNA ligase [Candidatus Bipolaricaulota bacterium]